jgi:hypothetical protein
MKPIQERAELALYQGLKCVQFRLLNRTPLKPKAYTHGLALRYGLIGTAAAFYALETADSQEERELRNIFLHWPAMVSEHFAREVAYRLPFQTSDENALCIGKLAGTPLRLGLNLRRQFLPLQRVLEITGDRFQADHRSEILSDSWLLARPKINKFFRLATEESIQFSLAFFDRRRCGLEELSEIALLGE